MSYIYWNKRKMSVPEGIDDPYGRIDKGWEGWGGIHACCMPDGGGPMFGNAFCNGAIDGNIYQIGL